MARVARLINQYIAGCADSPGYVSFTIAPEVRPARNKLCWMALSRNAALVCLRPDAKENRRIAEIFDREIKPVSMGGRTLAS